MAEDDVQFLNSRRRIRRDDQRNVDQVSEPSAIIAGERDCSAAHGAGTNEPGYHVRTQSRRRDANCNIAWPSKRFNLTGKDLLEPEVIADCCQRRAISRQCKRRDCGAISAIANGEFGCPMLGIRCAAAIAEKQQFVALA